MKIHLFTVVAPAALAMLAATTPAHAQTYGQPYDWNGFYIGGTVGGAWSDTSNSVKAIPGGGPVVMPVADAQAITQTGGSSNTDSGSTGSLEAGWNWQSGNLLLGIETDYGWFSIDESRTRNYQSGLLINPPVTATTTEAISADWIWTLRPRIGYASGPWLAYATVGAASTKIDYTFDYADTQATPSTGNFSASDTKTGWVAGLGGAYMLTPQISLKGEWLYVDFGNIRVSGTTSEGFAQVTSDADVKANLLRIGVDYKF